MPPTILLLLRVFFAMGTRLTSRCLAKTGGIHSETQRLMGVFYEVRREMGSDVMLLWHIDPLLGQEREISNNTTGVAK
jgi:hypothetical protein